MCVCVCVCVYVCVCVCVCVSAVCTEWFLRRQRASTAYYITRVPKRQYNSSLFISSLKQSPEPSEGIGVVWRAHRANSSTRKLFTSFARCCMHFILSVGRCMRRLTHVSSHRGEYIRSSSLRLIHARSASETAMPSPVSGGGGRSFRGVTVLLLLFLLLLLESAGVLSLIHI